jgi:hypothetical protein
MSTLSLLTRGLASETSTHLDSRFVNADPDSALHSLSHDLLQSHRVEDLSRNADYILSQRINAPVTNELRAPTAEEIDLLEKVIHQTLHPELISVDGKRYTFPNLEVTTYESEYIPPLNPDWKIQVIQSPMGTDKTGKLCQYIKETKTPSATFTSPRRTFTRSCTARFREEGIPVKSYLEEKITDKDDFVIISAESLRQLKTMPDTLCVDEVTSFLRQMDSGLHDNLGDNQQMLVALGHSSQKILVMDAHIDARTLALCHILRPNEIIHYQINTIKKRTDWAAFQLDEVTMYNQLSHDLKTGRNVKIICGSEKYAEKYIEAVVKASVPEGSYRFYHSKGRNFNDSDFDNVNITWSKLRVLMFTSTVTQGINYMEKHFHSTYIFGHSLTNTVNEIGQMMGRVRTLINPPDEEDEPKKVYFWNQTRCERLPDTYEAIRSQIENNLLLGNLDMLKFLGPECRQLCIDGSKVVWKLRDNFWTWLSIQNQLEKNLSRNNYHNLFLDMLTSQGIVIGKTVYMDNLQNVEYDPNIRYYIRENEDGIREFKDWKRQQDTQWKDRQIYDLSKAPWLSSFKQIQQYRSKKENGDASPDELVTLKKSELLQYIDPVHRDGLVHDGEKLLIFSNNLHQLLNCQTARDWSHMDVGLNDIRVHNNHPNMIPSIALPEFEGINWLCQAIGVKNVLDRDTIVCSEAIRQRAPFIIQNIPLLDARFKAVHQNIKDHSGVLRYVNARLRSWAGCTLTEIGHKWSRIAGKKINIKYYQLKAPEGFDHILSLIISKKKLSAATSP